MHSIVGFTAVPSIGKVQCMNPKMTGTELSKLANQFRVQIVQMIMEAKSGHPGGSLSAIDLLTTLWFEQMRGADPASLNDPNRDRFVLSKGHGVPALYAILAKKGFIS